MLFLAGILFITACSSSKNLVPKDGEIRSIRFDTSEMQHDYDENHFLNQKALDWSIEAGVDSISNRALERVIYGFQETFTQDIEYAEGVDADILIKIKSLKIKKRGFTVNFAKPGPIYVVTVKAEVQNRQGEIQMKKFKVEKNMAEILGKEKSFYKVKKEEQDDPDKQILVLSEAYNTLFGEASFKILGIRI